MKQETMTLTREELTRIKVMEFVKHGSMSRREAAETLGLSKRQVRRILSRYTKEGEMGVVHAGKGRKSERALTNELKEEVTRLHSEKYSDSNFTHFSELLEEHEKIKLSPSSIGRILKSAGYESKRAIKRRPKKHKPRERRTQEGMLWQTDATPYAWLGKEFGAFALHAMIDDATGIVVSGTFTRNECAQGYSDAMKEGIEKYGVPMALYTDKHTIFRSPKEAPTEEEQLAGEDANKPLSNFGKAMAELGIEHIKANSPQAKGRIERLWETLQDRLPTELNILGVKNIEEANKVLPELLRRHNKKFSVLPAESAEAYRPLGKDVNLDYVFARRETRKVGSGSEISYKKGIYVPKDDGVEFDARTLVEVRETLSGDVLLWHCGKAVAMRKIERPVRTVTNAEATPQPREKAVRTPHKPAEDHPWRRFKEAKSVRAADTSTT